MLQQRSKILSAAIMTWHSQINVAGQEGWWKKTLVIQRQEVWCTVTFGNVKKIGNVPGEHSGLAMGISGPPVCLFLAAYSKMCGLP